MSDTIVSYKGRNYRQTWRGPSKFGPGERAHLEFLDGSKDFWVDASLLGEAVEAAPAPAKPPARKVRANWAPCGYPGCNPNYCDECDGDGYRPYRRGH
jgi:hypothetical protein